VRPSAETIAVKVSPAERPTALRWAYALRRTAVEDLRRVDVLGLLGVVFFVLVWYGLTYVIPRFSLPLPQSVAARIGHDFFSSPELAAYGVGGNGLAANLLYTAVNVVIAVGIGSTLGVVIGLVSARVGAFRAIVDPIVLIGGTVPILVAAPFFLIWFGTSRMSSVLLVTLYAMFILIVFSQRAAENIDPVYEQSALTLGASRFQVLRDLFPGTIPEILGGVRIAFAGAWGLEAIAELLGLPSGLGKVVQVLSTQTDSEGIFAVVMLLGIVAVILDGIIVYVMRSFFRWRAA
jgi:ABC-type nitrate/sulfonate/bicarbonate transport system permease component